MLSLFSPVLLCFTIPLTVGKGKTVTSGGSGGIRSNATIKLTIKWPVEADGGKSDVQRTWCKLRRERCSLLRQVQYFHHVTKKEYQRETIKALEKEKKRINYMEKKRRGRIRKEERRKQEKYKW